MTFVMTRNLCCLYLIFPVSMCVVVTPQVSEAAALQ